MRRSQASTSSSAEQLHQRRHEQGADDGRVEDDAGGEADAELLDVEAGAAREHEEREHQDQRGAGDELAGAGEAVLDAAGVLWRSSYSSRIRVSMKTS